MTVDLYFLLPSIVTLVVALIFYRLECKLIRQARTAYEHATATERKLTLEMLTHLVMTVDVLENLFDAVERFDDARMDNGARRIVTRTISAGRRVSTILHGAPRTKQHAGTGTTWPFDRDGKVSIKP